VGSDRSVPDALASLAPWGSSAGGVDGRSHGRWRSIGGGTDGLSRAP